MLHFYDKAWFAVALAFAAPVNIADALMKPETACEMENGLPQDTQGFMAEADACLAADKTDSDFETAFAVRSAKYRAQTDETALALRDGLSAAAQLHAQNMAARGFVDHASPEGRDHIDRVRLLDRPLIFGAFGAHVAAVDTRNVDEAFAVLIDHDSYRDNLGRGLFNSHGIGVASKNGMTYIVHVFAQTDGELDHALPTELSGQWEIAPELFDSSLQMTGWRLVSPSGDVVSQGRGSHIAAENTPTSLSLEIVAQHSGTKAEHVLKGPSIASGS
ncbi:MAG: CAP domain-containing protein [Pseudomonadota bacterium]